MSINYVNIFLLKSWKNKETEPKFEINSNFKIIPFNEKNSNAYLCSLLLIMVQCIAIY
jgi:hypothetical protein